MATPELNLDHDIPVDLPVHHVSAFDLDDDAFREDDDHELSFQFSPDAIREDLARHLPSIEHVGWEDQNTISVAGDLFQVHNTSVSTIDINQSHSASHSSSPSPQDDNLDSSFSQISLCGTDTDIHLENSPGTTEPEAIEPVTVTPADIQSSSSTHISSPEINGTQLSESKSAHHIPPSTPPSSDHAISRNHTPPSGIQDASYISSTVATASTVAPVVSSSEKQMPFKHRPTRSTGPSMFEKVRSKTRPTFLPPKPRAEDEKHMADWQHMMKLSRASAEKRRKAFQERRMAREKAIEESLHVWEKEIIPDWRVVHRNKELRKLWWRGIPTKLRPILWERVVGNDLALSKDHYKSCLARAKRALSSGVFPQKALDLIEQDVSTTLPALHIFNRETGPLYSDLKDMLYAWVVARSDEGLGYTLGAARIAAMILINMPNQQGFIAMRNLLERHLLRSFFGGERSVEDVEAYYRIFDTLLADCMPKIYFNFKQHQVSPSAYLPDWLIPLFVNHLPFEACARIWDVLLLEGDSFLYRASLGILGVLEPRLFFPDKKELLELLRGENKAAIEVAKREGQPLDGGKYEIYGVDEETLWSCIDGMNDWWKESTWTRLIQRELPDL